jgi:hypothetical protein
VGGVQILFSFIWLSFIAIKVAGRTCYNSGWVINRVTRLGIFANWAVVYLAQFFEEKEDGNKFGLLS